MAAVVTGREAHVRQYGDEWDGGCLTCDECDKDVAHVGPCDCDHVSAPAREAT